MGGPKKLGRLLARQFLYSPSSKPPRIPLDDFSINIDMRLNEVSLLTKTGPDRPPSSGPAAMLV
jgi:hypothetical protein